MEAITRKQFDEMLADPDLDMNPTARIILCAFAFHMTYKNHPETVYKTNIGIAVFAGVHRNTASKYREALETDGFLIPTGEIVMVDKYHSTPVYHLGRGVPTDPILVKPKGRNVKNVGAMLTGKALGNADRRVAMLTDEALGNADGKDEQCSQERQAMLTGKTSNATPCSTNNQENNQVEEPREEPTTSHAVNGVVELNSQIKSVGDNPSIFVDESTGGAAAPSPAFTYLANEPGFGSLVVENGATSVLEDLGVDDYRILAMEARCQSAFEGYLKQGRSPREAYETAKERKESRTRKN